MLPCAECELEVPEKNIQQVIRWADLLSLAAFVGNEECSLDPVLAQFLTPPAV
jgi:hypothetical protein